MYSKKLNFYFKFEPEYMLIFTNWTHFVNYQNTLHFHSLQFILRQQVISLYREFMKVTRNLPEADRVETRKWIRDDFKMNMHLEDEVSFSFFSFFNIYIILFNSIIKSISNQIVKKESRNNSYTPKFFLFFKELSKFNLLI